MTKNKINPRKKPVTQYEVKKQTDKAIRLAIAIIISTVAETERFSFEEMQELWDKVNYKSDSISRGYVKMEDIVQTLEEEYGIEVGK